MDGEAEIAFAPAGGALTRLVRLYQKAPLRVLFPAGAEAEVPLAVLLNTSGGLVGGDRLATTVAVAPGGKAVVTPQAAEKVYRTPLTAARVSVWLSAGADSWLEWLPQETILFDGARLHRRITINVARGGRLAAGELLVFGRRARGEVFNQGFLEERWEVRREGRPFWAEALCLDEEIPRVIASPAGFASAAACATFVFVAEPGEGRLGHVREWLAATCAPGVGSAASEVRGVLVVRWLAADALALRSAYGQFWALFRHRIGGLSRALPRLWWS